MLAKDMLEVGEVQDDEVQNIGGQQSLPPEGEISEGLLRLGLLAGPGLYELGESIDHPRSQGNLVRASKCPTLWVDWAIIRCYLG